MKNSEVMQEVKNLLQREREEAECTHQLIQVQLVRDLELAVELLEKRIIEPETENTMQNYLAMEYAKKYLTWERKRCMLMAKDIAIYPSCHASYVEMIRAQSVLNRHCREWATKEEANNAR